MVGDNVIRCTIGFIVFTAFYVDAAPKPRS